LKDPVGDSLAKSASHRREEHHVLWPDEERKGKENDPHGEDKLLAC
jgi:hypothetical protein